MSGDNKKRKPGRPSGSKNKTALVRLDKAAAVVAAQVSTLKAEDKLYTLGKDRLAEIDDIMMRLALAYSPADKDENGKPCRPFWENPADEQRFLRFMGLFRACPRWRQMQYSPSCSPPTNQPTQRLAAPFGASTGAASTSRFSLLTKPHELALSALNSG